MLAVTVTIDAAAMAPAEDSEALVADNVARLRHTSTYHPNRWVLLDDVLLSLLYAMACRLTKDIYAIDELLP